VPHVISLHELRKAKKSLLCLHLQRESFRTEDIKRNPALRRGSTAGLPEELDVASEPAFYALRSSGSRRTYESMVDVFA